MPEDEERLARFEARLETILTQLERRLADGFAGVDRRFEDSHRRFNDLHKRFDDVQGRLTGLDSRIATLDGQVNTRLLAIEGRLTVMESRLDGKASTGELRFWGVWVTTAIGAATAPIKLWP